MMKQFLKICTSRAAVVLYSIVLFAAPSAARAAPTPRTIKELVYQLVGLLDSATVALIGLAVVIFFWSAIRNLWGYDGTNAEQRQKIRDTLSWGIIIIFVMVSIWGIIKILQNTLLQGI